MTAVLATSATNDFLQAGFKALCGVANRTASAGATTKPAMGEPEGVGVVKSPQEPRAYASRAASADAFMWAIASIEIIGLTPEAVGNAEPSQT